MIAYIKMDCSIILWDDHTRILNLWLDMFLKSLILYRSGFKKILGEYLNNFLPLSPPGWRGIIVPVGRVAASLSRMDISETAGQILYVGCSMELSRP